MSYFRSLLFFFFEPFKLEAVEEPTAPDCGLNICLWTSKCNSGAFSVNSNDFRYSSLSGSSSTAC
eukprot:Gb_05427 [translate_table: standard]